MDNIYSKIGKVGDGFGTFQLKSALIQNEAGDWGSEPDANAIGIIRSTNFTNVGKLNLSNIAYRTLSAQKRNEKILRTKDILIERSGGSDTQPVGRVGYITEKIAEEQYAFANFIQRISLKDEVDAMYVYYCLQQMYEMGITASMQFQTTGIRNLDWKLYIKTILPKPEKTEQIAIANILSKVDEAIAAVQNSIDSAERLKKGLMQNLLTGKMKPDGTFRTPEEFYTDPKFGKVPLGWEVKKVKDFGDVVTGKTPPTDKPDVFANKEEGYMFITPGDVDVSKYIEETERYVSAKGIKYSYLLPANSVCEVCIGSTIGKIGITVKECCTNQQLTSVIVNKNNDAEYFYYAMLFRREHFKSVAGVNATPQINKSGYAKYRVLCPNDKTEQTAIAQKMNAIDDIIIKKQKSVKIYEHLKKSLMQNLLTGKIRIK